MLSMQYRNRDIIDMRRLGKSFVPVYETEVPAHALGGRRSLARLEKIYDEGRAIGIKRELMDKTAVFLHTVDKHSITEITDSEAEELAEILEDVLEKRSDFERKVRALVREGELLLRNLKDAMYYLPQRLEEQKDWADKIDAYLVSVNRLCSYTKLTRTCSAMGIPCPVQVLRSILHWIKGGCKGEPRRIW